MLENNRCSLSPAALAAVALLPLSLVLACAGADSDNPFATSANPANPTSDGDADTMASDGASTGHESDSADGTSSASASASASASGQDTASDDSPPIDDTGPVGETSSASAGVDTGDGCECAVGPCCDGCHFSPPSEECAAQAESEYGCGWGTACGGDVGIRHRDRMCSGASAGCDGAYGPWSAYQLSDDCSDAETCTPGDSTCNADIDCVCTYYVTSSECPSFTNGNGLGAGGGEIFEICGTIDLYTGFLVVEAQKHDGSSFGNRPYQVRVSNPADPSCGPNTNYFVTSDSNPAGVGTSELTFDFQSQWLPGQELKGYCVTASTQPGDPGYDPANAQQSSWWWSDKITVQRICP